MSPERIDPRTLEERARDHDAFSRGIEWFRGRSVARRRQLDEMLATREFERVGRFACWASQMHSLKLDPHAIAPCKAARRDLDQPHDSDERQAAELRQLLISNNLSPFEPNPLLALAKLNALPKDQKVNYGPVAMPFRR